MPSIDPIHTLRRRALVVAGVVGVLVLAAAVWAVRVPRSESTLKPIGPGSVAAGSTERRIDPTRWQVTLWQPLSAEVPVVAAAPAVSLGLVSIVRQGDRYVAAIEAGTDARLQFVAVGQSVAGWTVSAVDAAGVDLVQGESRQRLELTR